jgi:hypothetical protein
VAARVRFEITTIEPRNRSSGFKAGESSKSRSPPAGVQASMMAPLGTKTAPKRGRGRAGVCASAVIAGTIASSSGRATVAPTPRRNVRRGNDRFVTNMGPLTG